MPLLARIPFFPKGGLPSLLQLRLILKDIVTLHRDTCDKENMKDFIDVYLKDLQMKKEQGIETHLSDDELVAVVHDLFFGGTETTSTTLRWALLYMLEYPGVQKRVQEEIDSVVGRDRLPKLSDKLSLPYTEAVIHEIQRFACIIRRTARFTRSDVEFRGYTIPKGTNITFSFYSVTRDPSVFDEPDVFNPERFLDEEGQVKKIAGQIVFGAGILWGTGDAWKEHRRFSLTVLRSFGVGKRSFEDQIATESECLIHEIAAVSNVICSVVFGKRYEYHDPEFMKLLHLLEDSLGYINVTRLLMIMPFLAKVGYRLYCRLD
ncbi:cytochrome P450 2B11-like [Amphiura filiformis]|uniref:cytochrome P450 2B11-like n=1 Tax=Amphiura filiformis TaxID=82378 RepID=UPI003B20BCA2